jgi:hypothetical protein
MKKQRIIWEKVASVTTGGKPYFLLSRNNPHKFCIVWNRCSENYSLQLDDKSIMSVETIKEGKQFFDNYIDMGSPELKFVP